MEDTMLDCGPYTCKQLHDSISMFATGTGAAFSDGSDCSSDDLAFTGSGRKRKLPQRGSARQKLGLKRSTSSQLSETLCLSAAASLGLGKQQRKALHKLAASEPRSHKPKDALLCQEGLEPQEPQEVDMVSPVRTSPSSDHSSNIGCDLFPLQEDMPEFPVCKETPSQQLCLPTLPAVATETLAAQLACNYGFTPLVTSLGMSYLQRLAAQDPLLLATALGSHDYAQFVASVRPCAPKTSNLGLTRLNCPSGKCWLICLQLACTYLAAKVVEFVPYKRLLQTMLAHVLGRIVSGEVAAGLEVDVLDALDWRLGPFFLVTA